jgi:hypothetical protein
VSRESAGAGMSGAKTSSRPVCRREAPDDNRDLWRVLRIGCADLVGPVAEL